MSCRRSFRKSSVTKPFFCSASGAGTSAELSLQPFLAGGAALGLLLLQLNHPEISHIQFFTQIGRNTNAAGEGTGMCRASSAGSGGAGQEEPTRGQRTGPSPAPGWPGRPHGWDRGHAAPSAAEPGAEAGWETPSVSRDRPATRTDAPARIPRGSRAEGRGGNPTSARGVTTRGHLNIALAEQMVFPS